jgi:hypothetical protein
MPDNRLRVSGWAIDPDTAAPIDVHTYVDGAFAGATRADQPRPGVGNGYPGYGPNHGSTPSSRPRRVPTTCALRRF